MLILGIETATEQVSCAIGGHEGVLGLFEVARGRRHAELLTPAIEFVCRQADITLDEIGAIAVDTGPGLFTGMRVGIATAKAMAQALRVPVIPMTSLDLLALPLRYADRLIAAVIDARRGEVYHASYRQVPGGVQRLEGPAVGPVDDLVADLLATGEDACSSATARCGTGSGHLREAFAGSSSRSSGWPIRRAAPLVQLAHAKALREEWATGRGAAAVPAPARCGDQLGHPGVGAEESPAREDRPVRRARRAVTVRSCPCGAATSAASSRSKSVYPRPWAASVFASEIEQVPRARRYYVAQSAAAWSATAGCWWRRTRRTSRTWPSIPASAGRASPAGSAGPRP